MFDAVQNRTWVKHHSNIHNNGVDPVAQTGSAFYRLVCDHDLEGVVAKWKRGTYQMSGRTSWLKIKNPDYSQTEGRHELFEKRRHADGRKRWQRPELMLT